MLAFKILVIIMIQLLLHALAHFYCAYTYYVLLILLDINLPLNTERNPLEQ